jgi:hypothetical protein
MDTQSKTGRLDAAPFVVCALRLVIPAAQMAVMAPAFAMVIISVAVIIAAIGLRTDRSARRGADNRANRRAASTADRRANTGTDSSADQRAANCVLRVGSARHRRERCQSSKSEKGLPHAILQPCGFAL